MRLWPVVALLSSVVMARAGAAPTWQAPLESSRWEAQPSWTGNPASAGAYGWSGKGTGVSFTVRQAGRSMKYRWKLPTAVSLKDASVVTITYRARAASQSTHYLLCMLGPGLAGGYVDSICLASNQLIPDGRIHTAWASLDTVKKTLRETDTLAAMLDAVEPDARLEVLAIALAAEPPAGGPWASCGISPRADFDRYRSIPLGQSAGPDSEAASRPPAARGGDATVDGVPFRLTRHALQTTIPGSEALRVQVSLSTSEVLLLVEASMTGDDDAIHSIGPLRAIRDVDRFLVRLRYADGTDDELMPRGVPAGAPGLLDGVQVLSCAADPRRTLAEVDLLDRTNQASLKLLAVTARLDGLRTVAEGAAPQLPAHRAPPAAPAGSRIACRAGVVTITSGRCEAVIGLSPAPVLRSLRRLPDRRPLLVTPAPLASLAMGERASALAFDGVAEAPGRVEARYHSVGSPGVRVSLRLQPARDGFKLTPTVSGGATGQIASLSAPMVGPYRLAPAGKSWYLYPKRGAALDSRPCSYQERSSGLFPLQFVDTFAPSEGVGVSLRTEDRALLEKRYLLDQDPRGTSLGLTYPDIHLQPDRPVGLAPTIVTVTDGHWLSGYQAYTRWVASWYRPVAPPKPWFREVFNFRQRFLHWNDPLDDGKRIDLARAVTEARREFGGIDYLHLFDWGNAGPHGRSYGRPGDTDPWPYQSGGAAGLRSAMAGVQSSGVPVGLYIEGYLLESRGPLGSGPAKEWQILDRTGRPIFYPESTERFMCAGVEPWRVIQARTYAQAKGLLRPNGMYIDEFGFGDIGKDCYSPNHGHPVPGIPATLERGMTERIRRAIGPDVAIYTEETPADVNAPLQDGSFTYAMNQSYATITRVPLNFSRFALPGFKTIEILFCDRPTGSWATGVKQTFFNGEATWLEGPATEWFAANTRATIRKCHAILREHRDAFAGDRCEPLVASPAPGVYVNRFRAAGKDVYTLYNAGLRTARGTMLALDLPPGARVIDAWNGRPARLTRRGSGVGVPLEIGPNDVGCVVVVSPTRY